MTSNQKQFDMIIGWKFQSRAYEMILFKCCWMSNHLSEYNAYTFFYVN